MDSNCRDYKATAEPHSKAVQLRHINLERYCVWENARKANTYASVNTRSKSLRYSSFTSLCNGEGTKALKNIEFANLLTFPFSQPHPVSCLLQLFSMINDTSSVVGGRNRCPVPRWKSAPDAPKSAQSLHDSRHGHVRGLFPHCGRACWHLLCNHALAFNSLPHWLELVSVGWGEALEFILTTRKKGFRDPHADLWRFEVALLLVAVDQIVPMANMQSYCMAQPIWLGSLGQRYDWVSDFFHWRFPAS